MNKGQKYSPEVRQRAVRMVFEHQREHESQWAAIISIASKFGCTAETLRKCVRQAEPDQGKRAGLTSSEPVRLKQLERENLERKRASSRRWAGSETLTTMRWQSRSSDCRRQKSLTAVALGGNSTMTSMQPSNGTIGSTRAGSWNRLATCRRRSTN